MKKLIFSVIAIWACHVAWGQTYKYVVNNDTIKCENAGWSLGGKLVCDGQKTNIKKDDIQYMIIGSSIYQRKSIDPLDSKGKKDFAQINVPNILLTDSAKVAVVITFYKESSYESGGKKYVEVEYQKKPACFSFISAQVTEDLKKVNISPLIFVNYGEVEGSLKAIQKNVEKKCKEAGANTIIYLTFYKSPKNSEAEKGKIKVEDFSSMSLSVYDEKEMYSAFSYKGRNGYAGAMRTFMEDYRNTEKR